MQIRLWTPAAFTKKVNSTKKPTGGTVVEGYFRNSDTFSMYAPRFRIDFSKMPNQSATTVPPYHYALIPAFGNRYFWVSDWQHTEGIWSAQLTIDPLGTYRQQIGDTVAYVLRSSKEWNLDMPDTKYPMTSQHQFTQNNVGNVIALHPSAQQIVLVPNYWNISIENGTYAVNIYGPNDTGVVTYWCTYTGFKALADALYAYDPTTSGLWDTLTTELPEGFAKAMADPMQFIESVRWYPFMPWSAPAGVDLYLGYYHIGQIAGMEKIANQNLCVPYEATLPIRKHPQASRGNWLKNGPYSEYRLTLPPFGEFDLDASRLMDWDELFLRWFIDYSTGAGKLYIYARDSQNLSRGIYLGSVEAKAGVEVVLNQNTINLDSNFIRTTLIAGAIGGLHSIGEGVSSIVTEEPKMTLDEEQQAAADAGYAVIEPLDLGSFGRDFVGAVKDAWNSGGGSIAGGIKGVAGEVGKSFATVGGGLLSGIKDVASGVIGGMKSFNPQLQPKLSTVGGVATRLTYSSGQGGHLDATFWLVTDEDLENLGRPLMQKRKISDLPGYLITENPKLDVIGTKAETELIRNAMMGGFYYE